MPTRSIVFAVLVAASVAYCFGQAKPNGPSPKIKALQQERISLLEKRLNQLQSLYKVGLLDRAALMQPRRDIVRAKIESAQTAGEKMELLADLVKLYDQQIDILQAAANPPVQNRTPGERPKIDTQRSDHLLLQSERIEVLIEIEKLK